MHTPFTPDDAKALLSRLEAGVATIDPDGNERQVPPKQRAKVARRSLKQGLPTWEELYTRFRRLPELVPDIGAQEPARQTIVVRRAADAEAEAKADHDARLLSEAQVLTLLEERAKERRSLPCFPFDPVAHPEAGDDIDAARACQAVRGYERCTWANDPTGTGCPRRRVELAYDAATRRLHVAGVPMGDTADPGAGLLILRSMPFHRESGKRITPQPLETRPALAAVRLWLARQPFTVGAESWRGMESILILAGAQRCGKSLAAGWALSQTDGKWVTAAQLAQVPQHRFDPAPYCDPEMLVIDDIGAEPMPEWWKLRLYHVVAERYAHSRRTIITTNGTRADFDRRYDERLNRRITESGASVRLPEWSATNLVDRR